MARAYVGIGSNLDDPEEQVRRAIIALGRLGRVAAQSSFYRSEPWGGISQPDFINAVVALHTDLVPEMLLAEMKAIESNFGRVRTSQRWGPRIIDLDLLTYDDLSMRGADLTIPHARLLERAFVLVPLAEIDEKFAAARDGLRSSERARVARIG